MSATRLAPALAAFGAAALLAGCPASGERRARVLVRAERALAAGDADQAATLLRHQLDETPRDAAVAARLAAILEPTDPNGAFAVLASLPEDAARDDVAYRRLLARLHVAAGRLEPAALLVALERDRLAEPDTVRALLEALAARGGDEVIERPLPAEWRLRIAGLLVDRPAPREAVVALARRHGSQGDGRTALALASEALRLSPGSLPALVEKARALDGLERRSEARRTWQLVLELDPGNGTAARFVEETAPRPSPSPATPISLHLDVQGSAR